MTDIVKGPLAETFFDREKALRSDLARVTAERDALRAEVEAMQRVIDRARLLHQCWSSALATLDALRARKVGG